jgi:hypothetical protein
MRSGSLWRVRLFEDAKLDTKLRSKRWLQALRSPRQIAKEKKLARIDLASSKDIVPVDVG